MNIDALWQARRGDAGMAPLLVALLLLLLPALVLVTGVGTGLISFAFLFAALATWGAARTTLLRDWCAVRWVVLALLANFLFALLCFALRPEERANVLERPLRMLLALSALLVVRHWRPGSAALKRGLIAGAFAGAVFVSYQRWGLHMERPGGLINSITFGDISLCFGLMLLAWAGTVARTRQALWPAAGALAALAGTIATGTRGGLLALLFAAWIFFRYRALVRARMMRTLGALALGLLVLSYCVPQTGMRTRVADAVANVEQYFKGGSAYTNVGIRLELWKGAAMLIGERPWLGRSIDASAQRMAQLVAAGRLDAVTLEPSHVHNDMLQRLVTGGVPGMLIWSATLIAPLLFFAAPLRRAALPSRQQSSRQQPGRQQSSRQQPSREQVALSLAGVLLVTCYASFGLTEVIFWSLRSCLFYATMVFILMGLCLNAADAAAETDAAAPPHAGPAP